jgi:hypothetical protein
MKIFACLALSVCVAGSLALRAGVARAQAIKPPTKSTISVGLRLPQPKVFRVEDLLISLSVSNVSSKPIKMLFDDPYRRDFGPWMTRCVVRNSRGDTVQRHQNKIVIERKEWTPVEMESFRFVMRPNDYRLRLYALTDLVIFDEKKVDPKTGRLPPGRYTVQVFFYDIPSDIVSFELRDPPDAPKPKPGTPVRPQKSGS